MLMLSSADFLFKINFFQKILSGTHTFWVQILCKVYQQMTKVAASNKELHIIFKNLSHQLSSQLMMHISVNKVKKDSSLSSAFTPVSSTV